MHEHEVRAALADDLVGDADPVAGRVTDWQRSGLGLGSGGGRRLDPSDDLEVAVLLQDPPLELPEPARGLDPQLLGEPPAKCLIGGEGVGRRPRR